MFVIHSLNAVARGSTAVVRCVDVVVVYMQGRCILSRLCTGTLLRMMSHWMRHSRVFAISNDGSRLRVDS